MSELDLAAFIDRLTDRLRRPLPGAAAWRRFSHELSYGRHQGPATADARPAAVVALLYPSQGHWHVPLTLRRADLSSHAGQVSLPGGSLDAGEQLETCALRELQEELGVDPTGVRTIGRLTPVYVYATNFLVTPFVAVVGDRPAFEINPQEVDRLLEVPLSELDDPARIGHHEIERHGVSFRAPHFDLQAHRVWGATSLMLAELMTLFDRQPSTTRE